MNQTRHHSQTRNIWAFVIGIGKGLRNICHTPVIFLFYFNCFITCFCF